MDKRYQVFLSSTYSDLKLERSKVIQTLMEMDCIPSGMELFPAADEAQWEFIKRIINDCDYYLLLIGDRYGSIDDDGLSYTEKEYDYAVERGIKVIALLQTNPNKMPKSSKKFKPKQKQKLDVFREKVAAGRLVKFWSKSDELPGIVALSLSKTITAYPAIGWVRADQVSNNDLLSEINELRKENNTLKSKLKEPTQNNLPEITNLAPLNEPVEINGKWYSSLSHMYYSWTLKTTWQELFSIVSPFLLNTPSESYFKTLVGNELSKRSSKVFGSIDEQEFQTIKIQFIAHKLVDVKYLKTVQGGMDWFWTLTSKGNQLMTELRTIKKK